MSCNNEEFVKAKPPYEEALQKSGHQSDMTYIEPQNKQKRQRKRNVIWFNPPFNANVTTNVAKSFLALIDKHFLPRHHRYHKLLNRNNVKTSYSCMSNMAAIISSHNARVLASVPDKAPRTYILQYINRRGFSFCLLGNSDKALSIPYKVTRSVALGYRFLT